LDQSAWLEDFRSEALEGLDVVDAQLLVLERAPSDPQVIRKLFVAIHTIKGNAAMVGLDTTQQLSHAMEDVLSRLRDEQHPVDHEAVNVLFQAVDALRGLVVAARPGAAESTVGIVELIAQLRACVESGHPAKVDREPVSSRRSTALLVEDSATVRLLEQRLLTEAGFTVLALADGQEALRQARDTRYDLIVTSVELRGMNGLELAAALREHSPTRDVPVIITTSSDSPEQRRTAQALGVYRYLLKGPSAPQQLSEAAREVWERLAA
jgi:chemotaxis protein histidine kinase CheA